MDLSPCAFHDANRIQIVCIYSVNCKVRPPRIAEKLGAPVNLSRWTGADMDWIQRCAGINLETWHAWSFMVSNPADANASWILVHCRG